MPQRVVPYLQRLRAWRTWLLIVTGAGQGLQWIIAPSRALATPAYATIDVIGAVGWRFIGALLITVSTLLVLGKMFRHVGHALGAAVYLFLTVATAVGGYWPSLLMLAGGLHCGEFWLWARLTQPVGDGD